jgi:Flp pilus assembly pilin Flp
LEGLGITRTSYVAGPGAGRFSGMAPSGRSWRREEAQTMAEYVVVLAVITPIIILGFSSLSGAVLSAIDNARSFL